MRFLFIFFFVSVTVNASLLQPSNCDPADSLVSIREMTIGPYQYLMRYDADTDKGQVRLQLGDKTVFSLSGSHFFINPSIPCGLPQAGKTLGKNRASELMVINWTGGAHCCFTLYHIALEPSPFIIQKFELEHSAVPEFSDLTGDGYPEMVVTDWAFAYWQTSFAHSPDPKVILSYDGTKWGFNEVLNRKKPVSAQQLLRLSKKIRDRFVKVSTYSDGNEERIRVPILLSTEMLEYIYSGNAHQAKQLLDKSWPTDNPFKTKFQEQFFEQLSKSAFYSNLKKLNTDQHEPFLK